MQSQKDQPRKRQQQAGFTIPSFAKHYGQSVGQVRRAVKRKEIKTVPFAGIERITPAEAERVAKLFGWTPRED